LVECLLTTVAKRSKLLTIVEENTMIGENLKKIRGFKGYTISRLAEESSLSEYAIVKIERGTTVDPKRSTLQRLAKALNVDLDMFYAEDINISQVGVAHG
jgi:transcriptional regulator with XRE-family HTH domain